MARTKWRRLNIRLDAHSLETLDGILKVSNIGRKNPLGYSEIIRKMIDSYELIAPVLEYFKDINKIKAMREEKE